MAFPYRGPQSPREDAHAAYSNPLSPQRNPNRLSGGMMMATNDVRGGLTRRFTTNALPTLSPAGQQRKQAAGDYTVSLGMLPAHPHHTLHSVVCGPGQGHILSGVRMVGGGRMVPSGSSKHPKLAWREAQHSSLDSASWSISKREVSMAYGAEEWNFKEEGLALRRGIHGDELTCYQSAAYSRKMPVSLASHYSSLLVEHTYSSPGPEPHFHIGKRIFTCPYRLPQRIGHNCLIRKLGSAASMTLFFLALRSTSKTRKPTSSQNAFYRLFSLGSLLRTTLWIGA